MKWVSLLYFDSSASFFQFGFGFVGIGFGNFFLDSFRSAVNQGFGFFQAQAGQFADRFDNGDLAGTSVFQDNVEFGLFFSSASGSSASSGNGNRSSSGYAEFFFQGFYEFSEFQYCLLYTSPSPRDS